MRKFLGFLLGDTHVKKLREIASNPIVVLGSDILTLIGLIVSLCLKNVIVTSIIVSFLILYIIAITIYIIKRYFSVKRYKKNIDAANDTKNKEMASKIIQQISTALDGIVYSDNFTKNNDDTRSYSAILRNVCCRLKTLFELFLGQNCVCIKTICTDELMDLNYEQWSTITMARDGENLLRSIHDSERQKISNNTSFYEIISKTKGYWASHNLKKLSIIQRVQMNIKILITIF